jgi:hypothetical protein
VADGDDPNDHPIIEDPIDEAELAATSRVSAVQLVA